MKMLAPIARVMDEESRDFVQYFLREYPVQTVSMVFLLIFSGLCEGLGLVTLLPILRLASGGGEAGDSQLANVVNEGLEFVGLEPELGILLVLLVGALVMKALFRWLAMRQVGYAVAEVAADLRFSLIRALTGAEWRFFSEQPSGHFGNAVSSEAFRAAVSYKHACSALATAIQAAVYAAVTFWLSWKVALASVAVGGVVAAILSGFVRLTRQAGRDQTHSMKSLVGGLTDALQGIKPLKAMACEDRVFPILEGDTERLQDAEKRQVLAIESQKSFQEPILAVFIAGGLYGAIRWGGQSFSSLIMLTFLFYRLIGRLHLLQTQYQDMVKGESAFISLRRLIAKAERKQEKVKGGHRIGGLREEIRLDSVSCRYGDTPVFEDLSLTLPADRFVVLAGPSGSGKTTLVDLLAGLVRPTSGEVSVDSVPLSELDLVHWRSRIGYVPQETILFHTTVYRNVALGNPEADETEVREALRDAGALEFVESLPRALQAKVGERGSQLSGGQRQRLAIARALVREPDLLILDEATTGVDPDTEVRIASALEQLKGELLIISISHQASFRELADEMYRLDEEGLVRRTGLDDTVRLGTESTGAALS